MYLDRNARELVLRFAYAGQPLSGKTRSLRALLPLLQGAAVDPAIHSPGEEHGRTLYFDWACYRGGSVQGHRLRCQIITVPGQEALVQRRKLLIESADVVLFVVDSDLQRLAESKRSYQELLPWLARADRSSIPLVFQCNKRDLPTAAPLATIRQQLGLDAACPLFESTATSGRGIRLAFIAALKAACAQPSTLPQLPAEASAAQIDSGAQLFELLQRLEDHVAPAASTSSEEVPRQIAEPQPRAAPQSIEPQSDPGRQQVVTLQPERSAMDAAPTSVRAAHPAAEALKISELPSHAAQAPCKIVSAAALAAQTREAAATTAPAEPAPIKVAEIHSAPPAAAPSAPEARPSQALETTRRTATEPPQQSVRRWSGQGPRPAVMPAADWRAVVGHSQTVRVAPPAAEPVVQHAPVTTQPAPPSVSAPEAVPRQAKRVPPSFETASARPAVMPIAAWRAWLKEHASAEPTAATEAVSPAEPPALESELVESSNAAAPIHDEVDSVLLPVREQPLANVWPVAIWQWLSPQFHRQPKQATCQDGVWSGEVAPGWIASSAALFGDHETGIEALGMEVQRRERLRAHLWPHRCLVLCSDGGGYWRLWELVRSASTLDQILRRILSQSAPGKAEQTAGHLVMLGRAYLKALESLPQASELLSIDLSTIAQHEGRLVYAGSLHVAPSDDARRATDPLAALTSQLRLHLPVELPASVAVLEICRELQRAEPDGAHKQVADLLCGMLMRYVDARQARDASAGAHP